MVSLVHKFKERLKRLLKSKSARKRPGIEAHRQASSRPARAPVPIGINLGIDFGTKFTKVCFRDVARHASSIISFSGPKPSAPEDVMLPSRLCIDDEQVVTGGFTKHEWRRHDDRGNHCNCTSIEYIKMRLAQLDLPPREGSWQPTKVKCATTEKDIEALTAFYLAVVIDRSRKWIYQNHAELLVGRRVEWSACLGVPVEYYDSPALKRFERVLKIAWFWQAEGVSMKVPLSKIRRKAASLRARAEKDAADCAVLPEIAAAVQSFISSPEAREGVYTYFDIGSGTLDGVMFRYNNPEGRASLNFYAGHVWPLGVSAISELLAEHTATTGSRIESEILSGQVDGHTSRVLAPFRKAVHNLVAKIFMEGKQKDPNGLSIQARRRVVTLPLFLGGGGATIPFYRKAIESTYAERLKNTGISPYAAATVPKPPASQLSDIPLDSFDRFSIAYGLSIPPGDLPQWRLPSVLDPITLPPRINRLDYIIDYLDTKDALD